MVALDAIRGLLWESLEHGIAVAKEHFGEGQLVDGALGSHVARFHARRFLVGRGLQCESMPLNGIAFRWASYSVRVLKADGDGELPAPGRSGRKQRFYCQDQHTFDFDQGEVELGSEVNLVVLWDVTRGSFNGLSLSLACPKAGGRTKASVEAHWYVAFPHPSVALAVATLSGNGSEPDLDIAPLESEGTGEGE